MTETKPLASLSSGLLARKGQARPAMRRQGMDVGPGGPTALDDLGWNDMGGDPPPSPAREAIETLREAVETSPSNDRPTGERAAVDPARLLTPEPAPPVPTVVEVAPPMEVEAAIEPVTSPADEPTRTLPPIAVRRARRQARPRTGRTATGKAAFTLRLDADRHLKLRLASALRRESAQCLVTRALDELLDQFDLDHLLGAPGEKG